MARARGHRRALLRTVEAHLILAGHTTAHTTPAVAETHGIALTHNDASWFFCQPGDGWQATVRTNGHSSYDWSVLPETIAPPTATAEEVTDAIRATLTDN
ncbi:hypothetical protein ACWDWS_38790 [Streptomyces sp. NPDC003328]